MRTLLCILFLAITTVSYGQFKAPKFGKIDAAEFTMTKYDKDTAADAVILFEDGKSYFQTNSEGNFQVIFEKRCRIKIFKKSAFDLANIKIRLYKQGTDEENLTSFKASTFNLENGKPVEIRLDSKNNFVEKSKNYSTSKFAFPQIKEGSIIEYSYTITSDFLYNFRGWEFQHSYPTVWSQYETRIPEYFDYRPDTKGYYPFTFNKSDQGNTSFTYYNTYSTPGGGRPIRESETVQALTTNHLFGISDVPAFKSEPNVDCDDNYIQSIQFELSSIQFPGSIRKAYTESWESVNRKLYENDEFGALLKSTGFVKDTVNMLCKGRTADLDKAAAIYKYVQKRMKWNGNYSMWASNGLKKPYKDHIGNSGEINMLLTVMLKAAGLTVNPVVFSTRDNGVAITYFPTITNFNSVLARLVIDDKVYLLDASSEFSPFGVLAANDINGTGRLVDEEKGDVVNLESNAVYRETKTYRLNIDKEGTFTGTAISVYDGYAAMAYRRALSKVKSNDDLIKKMQENIKGLSVNGFTIQNRTNIDIPISDSLNITIKDNADVLGNKIMFTPLLFEAMEKNIYKLEDRKYPVNYNYPLNETYIFEYTLPDGYVVESLPKATKFKNPDNTLSVTYITAAAENKITVMYKLNLTRILFIPDEYQDLKEFYNLIVKTHTQKIILKKA